MRIILSIRLRKIPRVARICAATLPVEPFRSEPEKPSGIAKTLLRVAKIMSNLRLNCRQLFDPNVPDPRLIGGVTNEDYSTDVVSPNR
jgi:hypothetical protein